MANVIKHKTIRTGAEPAATALAEAEIGIKQVAAAHTTASSAKIYYGENVDGDGTVAARAFGFGILDTNSGGATQSGIPIGGNLTFTGGTGVTTTVSGSGVTHAIGQAVATSSTPSFAALTIDDITIDGSTISDGGDFTLDAGGDIVIDAADDVELKKAGTSYGRFYKNGDHLAIRPTVSSAEIHLKNTAGLNAVTVGPGNNASVYGDLTVGDGHATDPHNTYLNILGGEDSTANILFQADQSDDAGDDWRIQATTSGTLLFQNDIASPSTYVTHMTITPHATITSSNVDIPGSLTLGVPLAVAEGGTALTSLSTLLNSNVTPTSLGLVIGTNVQAYDADLAALAGLTSAADKGIQFTGSGAAATYDLTTAGKALLDDANASAQRTTLGLAIGSDVQAYDAQLADLAGLAVTNSGFIVGDGSNFVLESGATARTSLGVDAAGTDNSTAVTLATVSGNYLSLSGQAITAGTVPLTLGGTGATSAGAARTALGLVIGTNVQAYDAQLDTLAGFSAAQVTRGIVDDNLMTVDDADAANNDYAKFTAAGLEGRSYSEVRTDLGLGDAYAKDAGIGDGDILTANDAVADNDFLRVDGTEIEGRTAAQVASDIGAVALTALSVGSEGAASGDGGLSYNNSTGVFTYAPPADATTSQKGLVEFAATSEVDTGTSTTRGVNVNGLYQGFTGSSNIVTLGTIATGTWEGTTVDVQQGGTGATSLTSNAILTGNGTSAIQAESNLTFNGGTLYMNKSSGDPLFQFAIGGSTKWSIGIDDDDSDKFEINSTSSVGSSDFVLESDGDLTVAGFMDIGASHAYKVGGTAILSDSSGTMTLSNVDALDATTAATIESSMESNLDTLNSVTSASSLATVGTIGTGTWQGGVIHSDYLSTDTAHLSGTQTFSGTKTFSNTISGAIDGNAATATSAAGWTTARNFVTTGDVVVASTSWDGTGNFSATATIQADAVDIAMLSATGTPSGSTYLRGDNTWATVSGGGSGDEWGDSVDAHIVPDGDNTRDLGASGTEFKDLYIDGVAYIDTLHVHTALEINDNLPFRFGSSQDMELTYDATLDGIIWSESTNDGALDHHFYPDGGEDVADRWRFRWANGGTFTMANKTSGSYVSKFTLDTSGNLLIPGELQTSNIGYTDGDNAITIADGGACTFPQVPVFTSGIGATTFTGAITVNTGILPDANDGAYLGSATYGFSDLFLAEGGVINWDNSDVTLTQSGNKVTVAGGTWNMGAGGGVNAGQTLALDINNATSHTYIHESSNDVLDFCVGGDDAMLRIDEGNNMVTVDTASFTITGDMYMAQSKALYFDDDEHSYIKCSSEDVMRIYTAGTERLEIAASGAITVNNAYTLPTAVTGTNDHVLTAQTDGSTAWAAVSGGGGGGYSAGDTIRYADGSAGAPGLTLNSDQDTGFYDSGTNELGFSAGGTGQIILDDGAIKPVTDNDIDLGTSGLEFKDIYCDGTLYVDAIEVTNGGITQDCEVVGEASLGSPFPGFYTLEVVPKTFRVEAGIITRFQ